MRGAGMLAGMGGTMAIVMASLGAPAPAALASMAAGRWHFSSAPANAVPAQVSAGQPAQSKAPLVLPMPKDQKELDKLILAGYTPHAGHLHPPGVKNCPLAKEGNEAVM